MAVVLAAGACAAPPSVPEPAAEVAAAATREVVRIAAGAAPAERRAGTIVFQSDREGRSKLFELDLGTGAVTRATSGSDHHDLEPAWSPDGRRVAFSTTRFDGRTFDLAVAETAALDQARRVTTHAAFERQPAWARDGRSLFFASEQEGTQAVFRVALDSGAIVRVSPEPERALMPAVAPDGTRLAYVRGGADGLQVVIQPLPSGPPSRLTHGADGAAWPAWSPDGARIACIRHTGEPSAQLEIIDVASRIGVTYVLEGLPALREPAWSPDGRSLVVAGANTPGADSDWDLVLVVLDPVASVVRLSRGRGNDTAPSWSAR